MEKIKQEDIEKVCGGAGSGIPYEWVEKVSLLISIFLKIFRSFKIDDIINHVKNNLEDSVKIAMKELQCSEEEARQLCEFIKNLSN